MTMNTLLYMHHHQDVIVGKCFQCQSESVCICFLQWGCALNSILKNKNPPTWTENREFVLQFMCIRLETVGGDMFYAMSALQHAGNFYTLVHRKFLHIGPNWGRTIYVTLFCFLLLVNVLLLFFFFVLFCFVLFFFFVSRQMWSYFWFQNLKISFVAPIFDKPLWYHIHVCEFKYRNL